MLIWIFLTILVQIQADCQKKLFIDLINDPSQIFLLKNLTSPELKNAIFKENYPTPFKTSCQHIISSKALLQELGVEYEQTEQQFYRNFICGNAFQNQFKPISHRYGGHQFGIWANQLGDGRAVYIAEITLRNSSRYEFHLKGAGKTDFSRSGDGRSVFRSCVREFLATEYLHAIGVETSRTLSLSVSEDQVMRDPFESGKGIWESTCMNVRSAPSWIRVGSFEILSRHKQYKEMIQLATFINENYYKVEIQEKEKVKYEEELLIQVIHQFSRRNGKLIAQWEMVGFCHGVMNTDNLSILGITIDLGPYGFMETTDLFFKCNHSDDEGIYSFNKQFERGEFAVVKLIEAFFPLIKGRFQSIQQLKEQALEYSYKMFYLNEKINKIKQKFGIFTCSQNIMRKFEFIEIYDNIFKALIEEGVDFTIGFRELSELGYGKIPQKGSEIEKLFKNKKFFENYQEILKIYKKCEFKPDFIQQEMMKANPAYTLRNQIAQKVIDQFSSGNQEFIYNIYDVLTNPFTRNEDLDKLLNEKSENLIITCSS